MDFSSGNFDGPQTHYDHSRQDRLKAGHLLSLVPLVSHTAPSSLHFDISFALPKKTPHKTPHRAFFSPPHKRAFLFLSCLTFYHSTLRNMVDPGWDPPDVDDTVEHRVGTELRRYLSGGDETGEGFDRHPVGGSYVVLDGSWLVDLPRVCLRPI